MTRTLNFFLYQLGWFACVLGAAFSRPWMGTAIGACFVGVHLCLATDWRTEVRTMLFAIGLGLLVDILLLRIGVYQFSSGLILMWLPPLWMSVLWMQFSMTLNFSLTWLRGRFVLSAALGFLGAPLAFLGGERIGAISFLPPRLANIVILAVVWCVAIPLLIFVSDRVHARSSVASGYRGFAQPDRAQ